MSVNSIQTTYRRTINPFTAGQIANARDVQLESARFSVVSNSPSTLPFGFAVGWVDGPSDGTGINNRHHLKGHVCARSYTQASNALTNFAGVAVKNVALPGAGTQVQGAADGTERVVDAYNLNDLVSIGSEGDFVVVCSADVTIRSRVLVSITGNNAGQFLTGTASATNPLVPGAIFISDSEMVTPYSGGAAQRLAVVRIRQQPR